MTGVLIGRWKFGQRHREKMVVFSLQAEIGVTVTSQGVLGAIRSWERTGRILS